MHISKFFVSMVALATLGIAAACSGGEAAAPTASPVSVRSEAEATEMLQNALDAYNSGDYAAWSRDWSRAMKAAIGPAGFEQFRSQHIGRTGDFVAIETVELQHGRDRGYVRWVATATFERGKAQLYLALKETGTDVEGAGFEVLD